MAEASRVRVPLLEGKIQEQNECETAFHQKSAKSIEFVDMKITAICDAVRQVRENLSIEVSNRTSCMHNTKNHFKRILHDMKSALSTVDSFLKNSDDLEIIWRSKSLKAKLQPEVPDVYNPTYSRADEK